MVGGFPIAPSLTGSELIALENAGTGKLYTTPNQISGVMGNAYSYAANYSALGYLIDGVPKAVSKSAALLTGEPNGLSVDFTDLSYTVRDTTTAANNASGRLDALISYTGQSPKWIRGQDGRFYIGDTIRCEYDVNGNPMGVLIEEARTNVVLYCRDLSNAAWTKTNTTAALTAIGIDGVVNSASVLTATAGNGTALQAITLASSQRQQSAYVKRVTGAGVINMTTDGGTTWTVITVTSNWTQVTVPAQTLANPSVGFRIVTNGDAIAVDFVQNETGYFPTSPILTTTVAVTRAADTNMAIATTSFPTSASQGTAYMSLNPLDASAATPTRYVLAYGSSQRIMYQGNIYLQWYDGTNINSASTNLALGVENRVAVSWGGTACNFSGSGFTSNVSAFTGTFTVAASLQIGTSYCGHIKNFMMLPIVKTASQLQTMCGFNTLIAIGDSFTSNGTTGLTTAQFYPSVASKGIPFIESSANYGISGDTSCGMINRIATTIVYKNISMAIVYAGQNDGSVTVQSSPPPNNRVFTVNNGAKFFAGSYILVGTEPAQVLSVSTNQITLTANLTQGNPSLGTEVAPDTTRNIVAIINYWKSLGIKIIYVMGAHFMNFSTGGDTVTVQQASAAATRAKQLAAAQATNCPYIDNYAIMSARITNGLDAQGSASWHYADGNVHLNAYGESILAANIVSAIMNS
jgi:hypothetical protein